MLIRISDRVRFCYREVVAAGALQATKQPSISACSKGTRDRRPRRVRDSLEGKSFFRRDSPGAAFYALSIKPSSYVTIEQGKNHEQIGIGTSSSRIRMYPVAARS